ncbi:zinc-binding alcohol dehydrogenase [Thalassobaculum sp.]|uniref:zinc-dependent alcohol dehydrogenase n=1 Tax=Thalassobaculum sp. TaxID=2022740 RepID=UPI0032EB4F41
MATDDTATAFWLARPGRAELRREELPARGAGEVLVETLFTGISRGTETLVFAGRVPDSQRDAMRCPFQAGEFPGPVKYGYCSVGRVLEGPDGLAGRAVFCLHPHQDRYVVPVSAVTTLPDALPPGRAVMAANMETALNAVWDAAIRPGDRVCVIGLGVVGLLAARLAARVAGAEVLALDLDPAKRVPAEALGLAFAEAPPAGADFDMVLHASGHPDGLVTALGIAGFEATVLEMSWYGSTPVTLPLGEAFHSRRLTIRSSQVGSVATAQRSRWSHARRMAKALELLCDPALDALVDGESRFADLPETMAALAEGRLAALCHRVRFPAAEG